MADDDFADYVRASGPRLKRLAFLLTGDHDTAEDLLQTAYARVLPRWRTVSRYDDPDAYLRKVMVNTRTSWWRRVRGRESSWDAVPDGGWPGTSPASGDPADGEAALDGLLVRGTADVRGSGPAVTPTVGAPGLDVDISPETDPTVLAAAGAGPYGNNGFRLVLLVVHVRGTVPEARDGASPYGVYYDDGAASSGGSKTPDCAPGAPLVAVDKEEIVTLTYPPETTLPSAPVMITVSACAPVGPVVRRLTVQIPAAGKAASNFTPPG